MVAISALLIPIIVSAVVVFILGALVWMVLPHHKSDFAGLPDESAARAALTPQNIPPGLYNIPHVKDWDEAKTEEGARKFAEGPNAFITVLPTGMPTMGKKLALNFLFNLVVSVIVAYVAGRHLAPGADYLSVFQMAGTTAWLAYGMAYVQESIWFGRPWSFLLKAQFDALLYGLFTAGVFGWMWPA